MPLLIIDCFFWAVGSTWLNLLVCLAILLIILILIIPNGLYVIWHTFALCYLNNPVRMYDFYEPNEIGFFNLAWCYGISFAPIVFLSCFIFGFILECTLHMREKISTLIPVNLRIMMRDSKGDLKHPYLWFISRY